MAPGGWAAGTKDAQGNWTVADRKNNHFGDESDPAWVLEKSSPRQVNRFIKSNEGILTAIGGEGGGTAVQLTDLHGDIAIQYPVDTAQAPRAADEYGNAVGDGTARYGWLGSKQRSTETTDGTVLMGARLYSPSTGRFLSQDSVLGGSCNDYDYVGGDPVNKSDLTGNACRTHKRSYKVYEGGVPMQIGTVGMRVQVCTRGVDITSSMGSSWGDEAGAASKIGWSLSMHGAYKNVERFGWVQWKANGKGQVCMLKILPICGYQERFEIKMHYYTSGWFGPAPARKTPVWKARCTNKGCGFRFKR
ncbi:RHS repeat protein [Streptomyces albipurpureus]|uniref:RHS repeat-associated core domain-containing protein n=1 Tax=Streptomyces albipurpureus TaxID=2897419 RepID=A0ABT0UHJ9_9ACTN|nr:RHS repeat-associated core domain-containing protein [Streptomyces sp. CWNU-1]MCM2388132.1 hypothetical protein [Streptomyces sp. CWNU-1]